MNIVNSKTFFFPKFYSFKVIELREKTRKRGGVEREGRKERREEERDLVDEVIQ